MFTKRDAVTLAGFVLFFLGFLSIILSMVGIHFTFLAFMEKINPFVAFLIKVAMIALGFILIFLSKTQYREDE